MNRPSISLTLFSIISLVTFAAACAPIQSPQNSAPPLPSPVSATSVATNAVAATGTFATPPPPPATATTAALTPEPGAVQNLTGQHVSVLGVWSGVERDDFELVVNAWEEQTGAVVDWEGTRDITSRLNARLQGGNPPDLAVLPNPGLLQALARQGSLVPLDSLMDMDRVHRDYAAPWLDLGSYDGKLYAFFYRAHNRETVWYNPRAFRAGGYTPPTTWDEWIALADRMVADGKTPFAIATESGPGTGWSLTDWISEIVIHRCGPGTYDQWVAHEIPWTDPCIKASFQMFGTIVGTRGYVLGGAEGILATNVDAGSFPLYTNPPKAYMDYLSSFEQRIIATQYPDLEPASDYDFFPFPTIHPQYQGAVIVGADAVVMLHDTPAARAFLTFLAGAPAQAIWVKLGGFLALNQSVSLDDYPDPLARAAAQDLTRARSSRFGAGDSMPAAMQQAWWKQMQVFVRNPGEVDAVLDALEATAQSVYR